MGTWIVAHLGAALSATAVVGVAAGWVANHLAVLTGYVAGGVDKLDADVLGKTHSQVVKAFLVKVEAAIDAAIPGAGDAKYAALTALIMHELPLAAEPLEPALLAVLTAIGTGAKQGVARALAPAAQSVPVVPVPPAAS